MWFINHDMACFFSFVHMLFLLYDVLLSYCDLLLSRCDVLLHEVECFSHCLMSFCCHMVCFSHIMICFSLNVHEKDLSSRNYLLLSLCHVFLPQSNLLFYDVEWICHDVMYLICSLCAFFIIRCAFVIKCFGHYAWRFCHHVLCFSEWPEMKNETENQKTFE